MQPRDISCRVAAGGRGAAACQRDGEWPRGARRRMGRRWLLALGALFAAAAMGQSTPGADDSARNVYIAGGQVRPAAPVAGDFAAVGARVVVDQPVAGDAMLAGAAVDVRAPVGDDLRVTGGDVTLESSIGGELFAAGGQVTLRPAASVGGRARMQAAQVRVEGRVDGPLQASAETIDVNGHVRGDVRLTGGRVRLGPQARLEGSLHYTSDQPLERAAAAVVAGAIVREPRAQAVPPEPPRRDNGWGWQRQWAGPEAAWWGAAGSYLALLACAAVLLLLAPRLAVQSAARVASQAGLSLAVGFGVALGVPVLAVLLFVTVLGIPLGVALFALYPLLLLAGFVVGVAFVGRMLAVALQRPPPTGLAAALRWSALGLALVLLAGMLPLAGWLVLAVVCLAGIGALVLELQWRRRSAVPPDART